MAAAAAGIFNHAMTAGQALTGNTATPMASSTSGTGGTDSSSDTSGNSATVSANDFLTLLVTEMQNQDPTANTDPNEYINQLVQVNSLEQLIDINQTLSGDVGSAAAQSGSSATAQSTDATPAAAEAIVAPQKLASTAGSSIVPAHEAAAPISPVNRIPGNLGVPAANASAQRVGHALDGHPRARLNAGGLSASH
jgi:flagellar basal-body rod modification protein FlgD